MSFTSAGHPDRWVDVHLTTIARAVSTCGDFLAATALVIALQTRGAGGFAVAALLIAAAAPPTLLAPVTGRLADRVDSRVLLPKATAIGQTASSIGMLMAPALGGLLVGRFGLRVPLLIDAASYLAITVAALAVRTRRGGGPADATASTPDAPAWSMRRDPLMRAILVTVGAVVAAVSAVNVADVFFIRGDLHGSPTAYGLLGAVWTGAMMFGAWLVVRRPLGDGGFALALLVSLAGACGAVALAATVPGVAWLVPLWALGGVFNGGTNVSSGVLLARRVPAAVRGRALAVVGAAANGVNATGYLLAGIALVFVPARMLIALCGGVGLGVALAFAVPLLRATRDLPAPAPAPVPQVALAHE